MQQEGDSQSESFQRSQQEGMDYDPEDPEDPDPDQEIPEQVGEDMGYDVPLPRRPSAPEVSTAFSQY